jgi:hypothetical protein
MTKSLEHAIERLRQMSEEQQDSIAKLLLHELDEDERWAQSTATHFQQLETLANDILEADRRGECEPLDPDTL